MSSPPGVPVPVHGAVRGLRVVALGAASLLLACGAHLMGGGRLPSAGTLTVTALLLGLVAVVVTTRRCRVLLLILVLGLEQAALHYVFAAAAASGPLGCVPAGHHHLGAVGATCLPTGHLMSGMGPTAMGAAGSAGMLVGHALAVLATAWLLARGEAWLWELAEQLVRCSVVVVSVLATAGRRDSPVGVTAAVVTAPVAPGSPRGPPIWAS